MFPMALTFWSCVSDFENMLKLHDDFQGDDLSSLRPATIAPFT